MAETVALREVVCGAVVVVSLAASYLDWRWRRVPNWLTYSAAGLALGTRLSLGGPAAGAEGAGGMLLAFVLMVFLFAIGVMGGGDVKLSAAMGAWIGVRAVPRAFLFMTLLGAVLSLLMVGMALARRLAAVQTSGGEASAEAGARLTVPYGLAIAGGALLALVW